jgi:hypothetical protein
MSDETRKFLEDVQRLESLPMTPAQKLLATAELAQRLTPEMRKQIETEAMACAVELQYSDPRNGTRAERRAAKRAAR